MFDRNKKVDGKFTKHELKEIRNISNRLETGEKVLEVAKQVSRRPGGTISGLCKVKGCFFPVKIGCFSNR